MGVAYSSFGDLGACLGCCGRQVIFGCRRDKFVRNWQKNKKVSVIRAVLWLLTLNLANYLITIIICEDAYIHKIIQCVESSEKLQSFWMFSNAIAIILSLAGIFSLELGGGE